MSDFSSEFEKLKQRVKGKTLRFHEKTLLALDLSKKFANEYEKIGIYWDKVEKDKMYINSDILSQVFGPKPNSLNRIFRSYQIKKIGFTKGKEWTIRKCGPNTVTSEMPYEVALENMEKNYLDNKVFFEYGFNEFLRNHFFKKNHSNDNHEGMVENFYQHKNPHIEESCGIRHFLQHNNNEIKKSIKCEEMKNVYLKVKEEKTLEDSTTDDYISSEDGNDETSQGSHGSNEPHKENEDFFFYS
ncbi:hypothetical protein TRFO_14039 [Tritrichomonas foetus]|uniref:Uncharacterized protein n=1 Tax=Tritrichomonas foetus TaxID=1144522 RepID=A0A1J4L0I2_9EUKA|nr:hypothetical protein TRFO_14039 [Tritrichomonas foetus]|eukprot:OHT15444.1 hypothetical protein TRFO_14039 [Tritrichomonas foetus]